MINFFLIAFLAGLGLTFWLLFKQDPKAEPVDEVKHIEEEVIETVIIGEEIATVKRIPKPKKPAAKMSPAKKKKTKTVKK